MTNTDVPSTASYSPLEGFADTIEVLLWSVLAQHSELARAEVWAYGEGEGVFSVAAVGDATEGSDEPVRRAVFDLLARPRPDAKTQFGPVSPSAPPTMMRVVLTDHHDLPRSVLVLTRSEDVTTTETTSTLLGDLDRIVGQAQRALRSACDLEDVDERLRLAEVAREVVRAASAELDLGEALAKCVGPLKKGFGALDVRMRTYPTDTDAEAGSPSLDVEEELHALIHRVSHRLWRAGRAGQLATDTRDPSIHSEGERAQLIPLLDLVDWGRTMLAPIGSGSECLGHLVLGRAQGEPPWTRDEEITAAQIGKDLGRAVLNARAFNRERQTVAKLREVDAYKSDLIASVSHHLRNPLASVVGHLELTSGGPPLPDEARTSLAAVGRNTQRLTRLVEDLLLFARVGDPRLPLDPSPVPLDELVSEAADLAAASLRQRDQHLTITNGEHPSVALGDREELDRLMGNLLSNAVKYTRRGGRVTISVTSDEDEATIVVSDEGIGISDEDQERLFTEFFRSTNPQALSQPGTGLGLAIVSRIVHRHGGHVEVESEIGVGSSFRVVLPALPSTGSAGRRQ